MKFWSQQELDHLKSLWGTIPARKIAAALTEKFGREINSNMVIGQAHRMKLPEIDRTTLRIFQAQTLQEKRNGL